MPTAPQGLKPICGAVAHCSAEALCHPRAKVRRMRDARAGHLSAAKAAFSLHRWTARLEAAPFQNRPDFSQKSERDLSATEVNAER